MKRNYQSVIVLDITGHEGEVDKLVQDVGREIEGEGATLDEIKQIGAKEFAYSARKLASGHYVNYMFKAEPDVIEKVQSRLKLNTAVHLQHYQLA